MKVLGWLELPEDQTPPERYWHSPDHIEEWFAAVRQRMDARARGMESIPDGEELDPDGYYEDPDVAALRST